MVGRADDRPGGDGDRHALHAGIGPARRADPGGRGPRAGPRAGSRREPAPGLRGHAQPQLDWRAMPVEIDIDHVARLARLELTAEEKERLRAQLGLILEHAAKVGEVAADDVPPTAYAIPRANVLRPDVRTDSLPLED